MELLAIVSGVLAVVLHAAAQDDMPCFDFQGNAYLRFSLGNYFVNDGSIHYSFMIKTSADNGLIMYASGRYGDDEAIFVRDGRLAYHLFNTSPTGVEGYFGGYYMTDVPVNTDEWVTVDMYRNWLVTDHGNRRVRNQTGLVVNIGGQEYKHVDYRNRGDVSILPDVYLGGYREQLSDTVSSFNGLIANFREEKNGRIFENPTLNYLSRVRLDCMGEVMPN